MLERVGFKGVRKKLTQEAGQWAQWLPELPRLVHAQLSRADVSAEVLRELQQMRRAREQSNRVLMAVTGVAAMALAVALWTLMR